MDLTTPTSAPARAAGPGPSGRGTTVAAPASQCPKCRAAIARDQRYCVDCGQRLADARPPFLREGGLRSPALAPPVEDAAAPRERARLSQTALVAGVGTLLLAMGVGVLIGKGNTPQTPTIAGYVPGVAATTATDAAAATTPTTPTDAAAETASSSKSSKADAEKAKKIAKEAAASGGSVISSNDSKPLPKKVSIGSKGSGKGYEDGEFTGNFFGP